MSLRTFTICCAAIACAAPLAAQQRGTMEFGAFGSAATFDNALSLKTGYGGGGRIGMYLDDTFSIEFEDAEMRASRPNGLKDVNVGILSGRLVASPAMSGALSLLVGAGAGVSTETNFMHSYGVDALVGVKLRMTDNAALRLDGVMDWLANEGWKSYRSVRLGVSLYRHPAQLTRTVTVMSSPMMTMREDSVSAEETRRLRARDEALRALRDSLARNPAPAARAMPAERIPVRKDVPLAALETPLRFDAGSAAITDATAQLLASRVDLLRERQDMTVIILSHGARPASSLADRRAQAVRDYLVQRGISASRIVIDPSASDMAADATRGPSYRLLITPDAM